MKYKLVVLSFFCLILITFAGVYWINNYRDENISVQQEVVVTIALFDSPKSLNNSTTDHLVTLIVTRSNAGDITNLDFYIRKENDTNWTRLYPSNNYTSGQIILEDVLRNGQWDCGERVNLSEPSPDWMTKPGKLYVKIIYKPSAARVYEGSVYVS